MNIYNLTKTVAMSLSVLLLFTGCALKSPKPPVHQTIKQNLQNLKDWTLSARMLAKTSQDGGIFSFNWQQAGDDFTLDIAGPLGQGRTTLRSNSSQAMTARTTLEQQLGMSLPIEFAQNWLKGLSGDSAEQRTYQDNGLLQRFVEKGWSIEYANYQYIKPYWLPHKLMLTSPSKHLYVKLIITEWTFENT